MALALQSPAATSSSSSSTKSNNNNIKTNNNNTLTKNHNPFIFPSSTSSFKFKPRPNYSSLKIKHNIHRFHIRASATLESNNGVATVAVEAPNSTAYGRQYFPLAAVVGQVLFFLLYFCNFFVCN